MLRDKRVEVRCVIVHDLMGKNRLIIYSCHSKSVRFTDCCVFCTMKVNVQTLRETSCVVVLSLVISVRHGLDLDNNSLLHYSKHQAMRN